MPTPPIVSSAIDAARRHQAYTLSGSLVRLATARRFLIGGRCDASTRRQLRPCDHGRARLRARGPGVTIDASKTGRQTPMAAQRQVAIVTGAASGIGRAMALGLLEGGIDVAGVDRDAALLSELEADAGGKTGTLQPVRADLADPAAFDAVIAAVLDRSGRIDVLVNNAGIGQGSVRADQRTNPLRFW